MKAQRNMIRATLFITAFALAIFTGCSDGTDDYHQDMHEGDMPMDEGDHMDQDSTEHQHVEGNEHAPVDASSSAMDENPARPREITVVAKDYYFEPADLSVSPGEILQVELVNEGSTMHMWEVEGVSGTHLHTQVDESASTTFAAPSEPGSYRIYCAAPGHADRGMVGTLTVSGD